ncbi:hypothetical protein ABC383_23895 [Noviherbaspirillum sp. 1P10PC]|uniref:hypothetical protein n=1 Tax=Noviherbaspirillum sp. 1P10PC TaxID=3132292 RepID=UPI0039A1F160
MHALLAYVADPADTMQTSYGVITLVQEHRFRLVDEQGAHALFVLAHDAPLEWQDLERLQLAGREVRVSHAPAPGKIAAIAHDVVGHDRIAKQPEQE